jgi:hypothetical protein
MASFPDLMLVTFPLTDSRSRCLDGADQLSCRGRRVAFIRKFHAVFAAILCIAVWSIPVLAQQPRQTLTASAPCNFTQLDNLMPLYSNLKSVNLYVDFPRDLQYALECRGREEECAQSKLRPKTKNAATFIPREITRLKDLSSGYPEALYPDNLAKVARPVITDLFAPVLARDSSCTAPEPTMLYPYSIETFPLTGGAPDVLNLTLAVTLVETTKPHIVVLTFTTVRQGNAIYHRPRVLATAIPLDLPPDAISKSFQFFMRNTVFQSFQPLVRAGP